jgi:hypothetical protein
MAQPSTTGPSTFSCTLLPMWKDRIPPAATPSLVHLCSCTGHGPSPANNQQYLALHIMVRSAATLIKLLHSPIIVRGAMAKLVIPPGALWNHRFYFLEDAVSSPTRGGDATMWGDIEFDIVCLMRCMPNLRKLHMLESGLHRSLVLSQVGQAHPLCSLTWLHMHGYPDCDFAFLCTTVKPLYNLSVGGSVWLRL